MRISLRADVDISHATIVTVAVVAAGIIVITGGAALPAFIVAAGAGLAEAASTIGYMLAPT